MTEAESQVYAPLGLPGSGRERYGAAMELYRKGRITAEVLEVYRVASAHDGRDPVAVLRELGLPAPIPLAGSSPLANLYAAARQYLIALDHPGAAEVAANLPADPGPERQMARRGNAVVDTWLQPALDQLAASQPALSQAIGMAAGRLEWVTYDAYPLNEIGEDFARGHAFGSIRGGDAPFQADDCDMGLFLIRPGTLYRDHKHAAPELYAPLTGPHGWRFGPDLPLHFLPAHSPVWNPPQQPHLTKVGPVPFLCLFIWTRDVNEPAVVVPARDWEQLEGSRDD